MLTNVIAALARAIPIARIFSPTPLFRRAKICPVFDRTDACRALRLSEAGPRPVGRDSRDLDGRRALSGHGASAGEPRNAGSADADASGPSNAFKGIGKHGTRGQSSSQACPRPRRCWPARPSHTSRMAGHVSDLDRRDSTSSSTNRNIRTRPPGLAHSRCALRGFGRGLHAAKPAGLAEFRHVLGWTRRPIGRGPARLDGDRRRSAGLPTCS